MHLQWSIDLSKNEPNNVADNYLHSIHLMKTHKIGILLCLTSIITIAHTYAQGNPANNFFIIPEVTSGGQVARDVEDVGSKAGNVTNRYREISEMTGRSVGDQLASGIMSRDTLLDYLVYLIRFVSQLGILIGAIRIILAWYKYAVAVFNGANAEGANDNIKSAITGVAIIALSYGFMKILTNAFL